MGVNIMDQDAFSPQPGPLRDQCPERVGDCRRNLHQIVGYDTDFLSVIALYDEAMRPESLVNAVRQAMPCGKTGKDDMLLGSCGDVRGAVVHLKTVFAAGDGQQG